MPFGLKTVRRFAVSAKTAKVVVQTRRERVKELGDTPGFPDGPRDRQEFLQRCDLVTQLPVRLLPNRGHATRIVGRTPVGDDVTQGQVEGIIADWALLAMVFGQGTLEHFANPHELAVLKLARELFGL